MKKCNCIVLLLWAMSLTLFCSCSKDEEGNKELEYFTIEDAKFVDADMPSGTTNILTNISINNYVINGGTSIISFTSNETIKKVYVSIQGMKGYYECVPVKIVNNTVVEYQVVINLNQVINTQTFIVCIGALPASGEPSKVYASDPVQVVEAGTGQLQISLSWDRDDDLDLHVIDPLGNHVYYGKKIAFETPAKSSAVLFEFYCYWVSKYSSYDVSKLKSTSSSDWDTLYDYLYDTSPMSTDDDYLKYIQSKGYDYKGYLDIDSNPACILDGINNENIFYKEAIPGTYQIVVDLYEKCGSATNGAKYSVSLNYKGKNIKFSDKQIGQFDKSNWGSGNDSDEYVVIGSFTVEGTRAGATDQPSFCPEFTDRFIKR